MGRVGQDPESITTKAGTTITKFSLATRRNADDTDWHKVSVFGKAAEIVEKYVSKGDQILVEGSVQYGSYENSDGETKYTTDIISFNIDLIGSGSGESKSAPEKPKKKELKKKKAKKDDDFDL